MTKRPRQDATDVKMGQELDIVAGILKDKVYTDYCTYEDEVADLIVRYCPTCKSELDKTAIGIFALQANIRNYIRFKGNITFEEKGDSDA